MNFDYTNESITPETTTSITINGLLDINSVSSAVAAAGTSQGTATALTSMANIITSGTGGVSLPVPSGSGLSIYVINRSGSTITVYPASGASIDGLSSNVGFTLPTLASIEIVSSSSTQWYTTKPIGSVAGASGGGVGTITFGATGSRPIAGNLYNIFIDTTLNQIEFDNGSTWIIISTSASSVNFSAGTTSGNLNSVVFSNSNNITFGLAGSTVTASASYPAATSLSFSNSNNITFGIAGSTVTASASYPAATSLSFSNSNNITFGLAGSTVTASASYPAATSLSFSNSNNITFGLAGSTVTASASYSSLVHSNANNVTFGIAGSTVTASASYPAATSLNFSNSNNITFGLAGSTVTASASYPAATSLNFSNSNNITFGIAGSTVTASASYSSLSFSNANNVTFGIAGSTVTASASYSSLSFSNANNVTFGIAGSTVTASIAGGGGSVNFSAGTTSSNLNSVVFSNSNNISFGLSGSTMTASVPPISSLYAGANITISTAGSTISIIGAAGGGGSVNFSAGTTSSNLNSVVFSNSNNISFGLSGNTITATVAGGGGGGSVNFSAGTTSSNLNSVVFSNSNNITFGLSGSTLTASVPPISILVGSQNITISTGGNTLSIIGPPGTVQSIWAPPYDGPQGTTQFGNGSVQVFPAFADCSFSASQAIINISFSLTTGTSTSFGGTLSVALGFYTRTGSTLSQVSSGSQSYAFTNTSNASTALLQGIRGVSLPINIFCPLGDYWIAVQSRTSNTGTAAWIGRNMVYSNVSVAYSGPFAAASNSTQQYVPGYGLWTATTTALPVTIAFSHLVGTAVVDDLVPVLAFVNFTA
jgi:hypothetical protein